jgi:hypothetical protein
LESREAATSQLKPRGTAMSHLGRYCRKSLFAPSGPNFKSRWRANEKITWGDAVNSPATSVVELRAYRMAIAACFVFQREISRSVFWDFFDSIGQTEKNSVRAYTFRFALERGHCSIQSARLRRGPNVKSSLALRWSVCRGRPEVTGRLSKRRF